MNLKEQILKASDCPLKPITVPEWDCTLYIRTMSGAERDTWELTAFKDGKVSPEHFRAKLLVRCVCDEHGQRVFSDTDAADLSSKSATVLVKLYDVAAKVNGLTKSDVDELTKN
jgi:hypothetical protein